MAEPATVARPYAEAVFALADEQGRRAEWSAMLAELCTVLSDPRVRAAVADPNLPAAKAAGLVIGILAGRLTAQAENFVRVLAENGRLELLPYVRAHYEALRNEREGVIEAEIASAFELEPGQLAGLVARLEQKTGRQVKAKVQLDPELIGGVRIVLGDRVIDGSARAQLAALESALKSG
jgi:F-type H+-transporting ATPase subunit delta